MKLSQQVQVSMFALIFLVTLFRAEFFIRRLPYSS